MCDDVILFSDQESDREMECQGEPLVYTFYCVTTCKCGQHSKVLDAKPHLRVPEEPKVKVPPKPKQIHLMSPCRICQRQSFSRYQLCGACRINHCRVCLGPKEARISTCLNCQPPSRENEVRHQIKLGPAIPCRKCGRLCHSYSKLCRSCKQRTCMVCPNERALHSVYCSGCAAIYNSPTCVFGPDGYPRYHLYDRRC